MANRKTGIGSFKEFFENNDTKFEASIETVSRQDENIANNRLFVWNFEAVDLEEMVSIFEIYKREAVSEMTRSKLNNLLTRKMYTMLREGYNPVECMLYASKVINQKLTNDRALQDILAERIRDIYLKSTLETTDILINIMKMWTWIPQLKVVITSIGLIGENEELLDLILSYYGEDENLKDKVFHAFMQNKTMRNLERVMEIITNLQATDADEAMGKRFAKEVNAFGYNAIKLIEKYNEHPAVSKTGKFIIRRIIRANGGTDVSGGVDESVYRETLATKSFKDDATFKDFMENCYENNDKRAAFLCRFSRAEAGQYLKHIVENSDEYDSSIIDEAIVSLAVLGKKGYTPAAALIKNNYHENHDNYAPLVADLILCEDKAIEKLVAELCEKRDHELGRLYNFLKSANLKFYTESMNAFQTVLFSGFKEIISNKDYATLDILSSNLQIFWDKNLYFMIPLNMLKYMQEILNDYAQGEYEDIPEMIIIAMMNVIVHGWNESVEKVIFNLYHNAESNRIRQLGNKILQNREVQAPK